MSEAWSRTVPELRFPEFQGEWEDRRLNEILSLVVDNRGKTPPISPDGIPLIEINALGTRSVNYGSITKYVSVETYDSWFRKHLQHEDILFSTVGATALTAIYDSSIKAVVAQNIVAFRFENTNQIFMHYLFSVRRNNLKFKRIQMGAVQPSVKVSQAVKIRFCISNLSEQKKVASFLSAVDGRIEGMEKKRDLLKEYKKGLMQKLFNQTLRFTDDNGQPFPDWEEKRVREIAPLQRGFDLTHSKMKKGKHPVVFSNGILATHAEFKVKKPGVVTGRSGTLGKVTYVDQDFWPHNTSLWVTDFCGNYPKFIYYFYLRFKFEKFNSGSTVPTLNRNDVHIEKQMIPVSYAEQQKIADCLSAVDRKIGQVGAHVSRTREIKQGLLQKMFV